MPADLDIDLLRSFAAVAEAKHFTRAAARLNCAQSAVSMPAILSRPQHRP